MILLTQLQVSPQMGPEQFSVRCFCCKCIYIYMYVPKQLKAKSTESATICQGR
jgi:hypothetical protein